VTTRKIVAVSAGLSQPSSTRLLADRLTESTITELASHGMQGAVETIELRELAHEIMNMMLTGFPTGPLSDAIDKVTHADGLILVTPLFTTTYSGLFKSFIDVLDKDSLAAMPVLLGATGGTSRHSLALEYSMRPLLTYLRAEVASTSVFAATEDWAGEADTVNPLPARIARAGREFAQLVARRENTGPADLFEQAPTFEQMLSRL
jgi:FMN reductase